METGNQEKIQIKSKRELFKPVVFMLIKNYFEHEVGKNAAALAYYLLFAIFPLLIFISNFLGSLDLNVSEIIQLLQKFLPKDIVRMIESYLDYVSGTSSHTLLWFSFIFSVWFPMRAVKGLMNDVRLAYHLHKPQRPVIYKIRQFIYTIVFLFVIVLTLFFSTVGEYILSYFHVLIPENTLGIAVYLLELWQYLRFLLIGLLMFVALGVLYGISLDEKPPIKTILPGITAALTAWMVVSIGFSFYVENFARYSLIYGALGAVIVLMLWLYMTAMILILGAEVNAVLLKLQE